MTTPKITPKQQAILLLLYKYRFLNRVQIQTALNHKDKKTINLWLLDLTNKDCLGRIYSKSFGENTKPAVYYLGTNGIRFLKTREQCAPGILRRLYYEKDRSEAFVRQCQTLAGLCLAWERRSDAGRSCAAVTRSGYALESSPYRFLAELSPSLVLTSAKRGGKETATNGYLLELLEPTLPRYSARKRLRDYLQFCQEGGWESGTGRPFPTVLLVCPTLALLISLKRYAKKLLEEDELPEDFHIWFATEEAARERGIDSEIWEEVN